jgi:hypothetical protein
MTGDILKLMRARDKAYEKYKKHKTKMYKDSFILLRNRAKQAQRNAKLRYSHELFNNNKSTKDIWKGIRALGVRTSNNKFNTSTNLPVTPDELNQHYVNVSKISDPGSVRSMIDKYLCKPTATGESFFFSHVYPEQIIKAVSSIKSNSVGEDGLPVKFLMLCLDSILPVLEHIFNFSLQSGTFPSIWKMANVKPIPKVASPLHCKDFRPVSILCVLAKAFEKIVHTQTLQYLEDRNIMNPLQSGFMKGHSTTTALLKVADDLRQGIDQKKINLLVLLDFSKAFDCVHHELLIVKMKKMGFSDHALLWFNDYLNERFQRVLVDSNTFSNWLIPETSVPQGSVLGPLLFALYINDISSVLLNCKYHLYADDVQLYIQFPISHCLKAINDMNSDLNRIIEYSKGHNLKLNVEKTQPIMIGSPAYIKRIVSDGIHDITMNGITVPLCASVKNLGVIFDSYLCWEPYVFDVIKRVFQRIAQIRRNMDMMPLEIRKTIVRTLLMPIFDYASPLFSNISQTLSVKIQRAQNACVRFITGGRKYDHVTPIFKELGMLKLNDRRVVTQAILIWKIIKYRKPMYLYEKFTFMSAVHDRNNRNTSRTLLVPKHRTEMYAKSFTVTSTKLWNSYDLSRFQSYKTYYVLKRSLFDVLFCY